MRIKEELPFSVQRKRVIYLMTKTYRIRNNYTLDATLNYADLNHLSIDIYIVTPYEENVKSIEFFKKNTMDLVSKLKKFSQHVNVIERHELTSVFDNNIQAIFTDFAYLRFDISLFQNVKKLAIEKSISLFQVESNVFVPIKDASDKEEYGAYTIRRKIKKLMPYYMNEVLTDELPIIGEKAALNALKLFIEDKLEHYEQHNDPSKEYTSRLSAYLKYGFISPVTIYNALSFVDEEIKSTFLEELIIRRELAYNYVYYNPDYDKFDRMTEKWAYQTMRDHEDDHREYQYVYNQYVEFKTHDPYFNAAMKEMIYTGYMHGYMRMYWAKKIIEWSKSYKEAYETIITLNNKYFIDGLTPNGYTGVAWCFGKHDRPWKERQIFGKLRYMNDNGLKRKFDIESYVEKINKIGKRLKK